VLLRRPSLPLPLVVLLLVMVGCGNGQSSAGDQAAHTRADAAIGAPAETTATSTSAAADEPGGPLETAGTLVKSDGQGTTISQDFRIGPLLYGQDDQPPNEVLDACNANYSTTIAQSVFARGEIDLSYTEGSLPLTVTFDPSAMVYSINGDGLLSAMAFQVDGAWQCGADSNSINLVLDQGETETLPFWFLASVLSNAEPRVSQATLDSWAFGSGVFLSQGNQSSWETRTSGPNAARCSNDDVLMLYAKAPFSMVNELGNEVPCKPV
jgi:hypothetical protein